MIVDSPVGLPAQSVRTMWKDYKMAEGYTIRIFVPDGDPEGLRIIDRMNWTGRGLVFPRTRWERTRSRAELSGPGVYILVGYPEDADDADDDRPIVYIGQGDNVARRIESHDTAKSFWDRAVVFVSTNGSLNRGHITWLEHAFIRRAAQVGLSKLDNGNAPQEPMLSEAEKADTEAFMREMLQILPLVGVTFFDEPKPVATPRQNSAIRIPQPSSSTGPDTIIVPAREHGFNEVFLGENQWRSIRIGHDKLNKIRYCAAYVTAPTQAVTYYAPVDRIEPSSETGKYRLIFSEPARPLPRPIPLADAGPGLMQAPRYTTYEKLMAAKKLSDLFA